MKDIVFLKGKESAWVGILLFLAVLVFIVPIAVVFIVRGIYRMFQIAKEQTDLAQEVSTVNRKTI